ncbi:hypothetical protein [Variovorax sp. PBL-E5]|uniref:hypothetical protein n=1 Tax=Variovorax sp. PBL-E5 TaxID=434014 RepID=UPI00131972B5|nr:hypothetical protein [Variovorax sp. PBL-E5]VTU34205.1 hypothetical protein E5CHR_03772 [Variovorax sp. PBL-E5]
MLTLRIRRLIAKHCMGWCVLGIALAVLQPFIGAHFCQDGLENEGEFFIRSPSTAAFFEPDQRAGHQADRETTLFASSAASIDVPHALQQGIDGLMALVLLLLPLTVLLLRPGQRVRSGPAQRVPNTSGAPPPAAPWRRQPPETAPPFAT